MLQRFTPLDKRLLHTSFLEHITLICDFCIDNWEFLWITHFFFLFKEPFATELCFLSFWVICKRLSSHTLSYSSRACFPDSEPLSLATFTFEWVENFPNHLFLVPFYLTVFLSNYPLAFYNMLQKVTRLHFQFFAWKSPQLNVQVMVSKLYSLHICRT